MVTQQNWHKLLQPSDSTFQIILHMLRQSSHSSVASALYRPHAKYKSKQRWHEEQWDCYNNEKTMEHESWVSDVAWDPRKPRYLQVTRANCKPGSEGLVHASIVENINFSQYLLQYLPTRFNRKQMSIFYNILSFLCSNFVWFDYFYILRPNFIYQILRRQALSQVFPIAKNRVSQAQLLITFPLVVRSSVSTRKIWVTNLLRLHALLAGL